MTSLNCHHPDQADPGHAHDHELVFDRFSFTADDPFDRVLLTAVLAALPAGVVRAKGVLYLADAPDDCVILQLVGRRWTLKPGAPWGDVKPATRLVLIAPHNQVDADGIQAEFAGALVAGLAGCRRT